LGYDGGFYQIFVMLFKYNPLKFNVNAKLHQHTH